MKLKVNDKISKIFTDKPKTVTKNDKISTVWKLMSDEGFHHVPVVENGKLLGMISHTDLMKLNFSDCFGEQTDEREIYAWLDSSKTIEEVMKNDIETIPDNSTIADAVRKLKSGQFHSLPILDKEKNLCAIVTTTDVLKWVANDI